MLLYFKIIFKAIPSANEGNCRDVEQTWQIYGHSFRIYTTLIPPFLIPGYASEPDDLEKKTCPKVFVSYRLEGGGEGKQDHETWKKKSMLSLSSPSSIPFTIYQVPPVFLRVTILPLLLADLTSFPQCPVIPESQEVMTGIFTDIEHHTHWNRHPGLTTENRRSHKCGLFLCNTTQKLEQRTGSCWIKR